MMATTFGHNFNFVAAKQNEQNAAAFQQFPTAVCGGGK